MHPSFVILAFSLLILAAAFFVQWIWSRVTGKPLLSANTNATGSSNASAADDRIIDSVTLEAMQGEWELVSIGRNGNFAPQHVIDNSRMTMSIDGDNMSVVESDGSSKLKVDNGVSPTQLDQLDDDGDLHLCIVRIRNDELEICQGEVGKDRPTDFNPNRSDGASLVRYAKQAESQSQTASSPEKGNIAISMIPCGEIPSLSAEAIRADLSSTWSGMPALGKRDNDGEGMLSFDVGDGAQVILATMPGPVPWSDLEGPCATSVLWKKAADVLKPHTAHVLVTIRFSDDRSPIERSTLLTQVTAAVVHTCKEALGVYWCNATLVIQPELFREFAVQVLPDDAPIHIWIDFRMGTDKHGKSSGFTHGLKALGHMEMETENSPEPIPELRARFEGLVAYLLEHGPVIKNGDTLGEDANERIKAVYSPSSFGHEGQVIRLDYEAISG